MSYCIQMGSGKVVDPFALRDEDIELSDIVNNLAHEVRFGGNAGDWTVAQHTLVVYELVRSATDDRELWKCALLHDAGEAYLKDMPKPIKHRPDMLVYRQAEERARRVICEKFGVVSESPLVKQMDDVATYLEAQYFLGELAPCWEQWKPEMDESLEQFGRGFLTFVYQDRGLWEVVMQRYFGAAEPQEGK
jgi:hypothetical protein